MAEQRNATIERRWFTYEEACDYAKVHRTTLWRAVNRGDLRCGRAGRVIRFERSELDRWLRGEEK